MSVGIFEKYAGEGWGGCLKLSRHKRNHSSAYVVVKTCVTWYLTTLVLIITSRWQRFHETVSFVFAADEDYYNSVQTPLRHQEPRG